MAADESHRYAAFISYSRHADAQVAPALEDGLERFAKPWNRLRALRVFRDDADLSASPGLWSSITAALDDAEYFILLASGEAAQSTWVAREIEYWRSHRDVSRVLLVLTEGELAWDEAAGDFDWGRSTAVPEALRGAFAEEPRYTDLRWARNGGGLTLEDDRFQEAVADLAGTLHGRPKDEMIGEQVRQHRRTIRLARGAVAVLSVLALAATVAAVLAVRASKRAEAEARTALSRQLAAESGVAVRDGELDSALLLAAQAPKERDTFEARSALAAALVASSHLDGIVRETPIERAAMSPDGNALAVVRRNGPVVVRDVRGRRVLGTVPSGAAVASGPELGRKEARDQRGRQLSGRCGRNYESRGSKAPVLVDRRVGRRGQALGPRLRREKDLRLRAGVRQPRRLPRRQRRRGDERAPGSVADRRVDERPGGHAEPVRVSVSGDPQRRRLLARGRHPPRVAQPTASTCWSGSSARTSAEP